MVVDLDEFVYSRNGYSTIKEYLNSLNSSIFRIKIPWKLYGSNGFINQPESVIQSFTKRQQYKNNHNINIKTIVRGNVINWLGIHNSYLINDNNLNIDSQIINEETLQTDNLHLNHYAIQSLDFFTNVKMTRGDAQMHENVRTLTYFYQYDYTDIIDELKNIS